MDHKELQQQISEKIKGSTDQVSGRVIDQLVEAEVAKRAESIATGLDIEKRLSLDLKKIKPDQKIVDAEGKLIQEGFSPAKQQDLQKLTERLQRCQAALDKAIGEQDFQKLNEVIQKEKGGKE
jgi:hypothetical protein